MKYFQGLKTDSLSRILLFVVVPILMQLLSNGLSLLFADVTLATTTAVAVTAAAAAAVAVSMVFMRVASMAVSVVIVGVSVT